MHKIDVEHTLARLAHYEALNKAHIAQHQQQREQESAQQDEADAFARHERMRRAQQVREEQEREQLEARLEEEKNRAVVRRARRAAVRRRPRRQRLRRSVVADGRGAGRPVPRRRLRLAARGVAARPRFAL